MGKTPEFKAAKRSRVIKNGETLLGLPSLEVIGNLWETSGGRMKGLRQVEEDPVTPERRQIRERGGVRWQHPLFGGERKKTYVGN